MLSDRCPVLSVLSVTLVYCGQTVGRLKMKLGMQVASALAKDPDKDPAPAPQRGTAPQFLAHICCGQMAAWIKMSRHLELDGAPTNFRPMFIVAKRLDG